MEIRLNVNGKEINVGVESAKNIVSDIPDGWNTPKTILKKLIKHKDSDVSKAA